MPPPRNNLSIRTAVYSLLPYLNTLEKQARTNLEHLIMLGVGYLLAFVLWRKSKAGEDL